MANYTDLGDAFMNGGDADTSRDEVEAMFKITDIKRVDTYQEDWMDDPSKDVLVFTLKNKSHGEVKVFQSLLNKEGNPSGNLFYGMSYENQNFYAPSTMLALKEAVKGQLGDRDYDAEKKKHKGINANFFKGKVVKMVMSNEKIGFQLPLTAKANLWKYLIKEGHVETYEEIDDFREYFKENVAESVFEEKGKTVSKENEDIDPDDLPF